VIPNHIFLLYLLFKESIIKLLVSTWQGQTLILFVYTCAKNTCFPSSLTK
ncbi:unnamed protein product, partial [Larinioides sclopetarius]